MTYPVWIGEWVEVNVPEMAGEALVVPNVAAVVLAEDRTSMLLQRRDKDGEPVRGRLEIPGGRWAAGEPPDRAVTREVAEETGVAVIEPPVGTARLRLGEHRACAVARPIAVVNGIEGTYPSLHVLFECVGRGEPQPSPGETADPRWWPLDEVQSLLEAEPEAFVDQTRAMLSVYFAERIRERPGDPAVPDPEQ
jgi:ADP-ribose pyrophosphatase YjhB (NUDIX family)